MPGFSTSPPHNPMDELELLSVTRINILEKLLHREMELHQTTKSMLTQSRAYCKAWEHAHAEAKAELHHVQVQLSAVEQAAREVLMENHELKRAVCNINFYRPVTPISSDCDEEAVKNNQEESPTSIGEIPIRVARYR